VGFIKNKYLMARQQCPASPTHDCIRKIKVVVHNDQIRRHGQFSSLRHKTRLKQGAFGTESGILGGAHFPPQRVIVI
jgi:hypothetical protein